MDLLQMYEIAEKTPQGNFEGETFCQFQQNQNSYDENECGHNLMSLTSKVSKTITFFYNKQIILNW